MAEEVNQVFSSGISTTPLKPFLRWAGGKRRLAELIISAMPESFNSNKNRYFEPFLGGGAIVFALGDTSRELCVPGRNLFLNDTNPDLIITYKVLKSDVYSLIRTLHKLSRDTSKEAYEKIRASNPRHDVSRAARFIYLNKTCFNGLWRVNSNGDFNVPWGKLKKPNIFVEENLISCSKRLKGSHLTKGDFAKALEKASKGDLVYLDPPYIPLTASANFSKYSKDDFSIKDHERLAELISDLKSRGVHIILSNSDTPLSRDLFGRALTLRQVSVNRSISAKGTSRKPVIELIGTSFPVPSTSQLSRCRKINHFKR